MIALLARPDSAPLSSPSLKVLAGLHTGVSVDLESDVCRIGSDPAADILLSDAGVLASHLTLRLMGRHEVAIEARGGDVSLGEQVIAAGTGIRCRLPVQLSVGEARLAIARPPQTPSAFAKPAVAACVTLVSVLGVYSAMSVSQAQPGDDLAMQIDALNSLPATAAGGLAVLSDAEVAQALRERLVAARLPMLQVVEEDHYLRVSGEVDVAQRARWGEVQQWFDGNFGTRHVLQNGVTLQGAVPAPRLRVQGVWLGDKPYVVGERGERLYPGANVGDGWVLHSIEPKQLVMVRNGKEFKLTL